MMRRAAPRSRSRWTRCSLPSKTPPNTINGIRKAKTAERYLQEQMAIARRDLEYLESVLEEIAEAETEQDFIGYPRMSCGMPGFLRSQGKGKKETQTRRPSPGNSAPPAVSGCWWAATTGKMTS